MILSVSRRTDVPAFFSDWFFAGLERGWFDVVNPYRPASARRVTVSPETVDCIVFWTKNPALMLAKLDRLDGYRYYFQYTLNGYGAELEPEVPAVADAVRTFSALARRIGRERLLWRYDPIVFSDRYDVAYHIENFSFLAEQLAPYCRSSVISFVDFYRKCLGRFETLGIRDVSDDVKFGLAMELSAVGRRCGLRIASCAEAIDLAAAGIRHGSCIDPVVIASLGGGNRMTRDRNQRPGCGCVSAVDIGTYGSCRHGCIYCYASR